MKSQNKIKTLLLAILLAVITILAWIISSYFTSKYFVKLLEESDAIHISDGDIMQAWIAPYFMYGVIFFVAWINIVGRIR